MVRMCSLASLIGTLRELVSRNLSRFQAKRIARRITLRAGLILQRNVL